MASSMKDIKLRIGSVSSTMQITKAMELVASSKLRRAQEQLAKSRPYFDILHSTLRDVASAGGDEGSVYTDHRPVQRTCWIVIAGDRGLAGGYNSNVLKLAHAEMGAGDNVVVPVGKKAVEYFRRRGVPMLTEGYDQASELSVSDCFTLARTLCQGFAQGEYDEIHIAYTTFQTVLSQQPTTMKLLPLDVEEKTAGGRQRLVTYEPDCESVYQAIVPEYLGGLLYGALCQSLTSEQGARRTAMDSATQNAKEMIEDLNLRYNRARQGAITQEITEIVAGSQN